jgi:hypothetical protein
VIPAPNENIGHFEAKPMISVQTKADDFRHSRAGGNPGNSRNELDARPSPRGAGFAGRTDIHGFIAVFMRKWNEALFTMARSRKLTHLWRKRAQ